MQTLPWLSRYTRSHPTDESRSHA